MKLCAYCNKNPAELTVTDVHKEGKAVELNVCRKCAEEKGLVAQEPPKLPVGEILKELQTTGADDDSRLVCSHCGLTYAEFKQSLRLGCPACYAAFAERLNPTIRRIHGSLRHVGRVPQANDNAARDFELQRLRRELKKAIAAENYERAASVRDLLRRAGGGEGDEAL
jgi:protein arginine kinase activator